MPFDEVVESTMPILTPTLPPVEYGPDIIEWPWPRLFVTSNKVIGMFKQSNGHLHAFEMFINAFESWEAYAVADLGIADAISFIDVCDFGPYYLISVMADTLHLYARDPSLDIYTVDREFYGVNLVHEISEPVVGTCCNHKGQFIGGNVMNWQDLQSNGIVWSGIGAFEFDPAINKTAGYRSLLSNRSDGTVCSIQRILPMQEAVIVYTNHGNVAFVDDFVNNSFTYGIVPLNGFGILSGNHVAGDDYTHGFIDLNKDFWILENLSYRSLNQIGGKITKRGYRDFIKPLFESDSEVIVSYVAENHQFYISNGLYSLIINDFGAFTAHQAISSVMKGWNGNFYGTFRDFGEKEARITLDSSDFGSRGLKTLESVLAGVSCAENTNIHASTKWKIQKDSIDKASRWVPVNPRGETRICLSALEYKIQLRFSTYIGTSLSGLVANVKFPDARFRRGVAATVAGAS